MHRLIPVALALLLSPVVVFVCGAWILTIVSGRRTVPKQKPLNGRLGYDLDAVDRYWGALDKSGLEAEQRFLALDLIFPVFYGGALAASLLMASAMLERPLATAWLVVLVVVTVVADWRENLVQMEQLRRFIEAKRSGLVARRIRAASLATIVKLVFFSLSYLALLGLTAAIVFVRPD